MNKRGVGLLTAIIVHTSLKFLLCFRLKSCFLAAKARDCRRRRGAQRGESLEQRQKPNQPPSFVISADLFGVKAA